jgi:hypothetical protein
LEGGGELFCPYRDDAVRTAGSTKAIAERYATRDLVYLSGEYDIVPQDHDHCAARLQGSSRHERAIEYFNGLAEYFGRQVHELYVVPNSNHDHAIMFQSDIGRQVILRKGTNKNSESSGAGQVGGIESYSQTSRKIIPF